MRRLINLLHPRAPKGIILSAREWAESWSRRNPAIRAEQPAAWCRNLEPTESQVVDFDRVRPVTEEDYLLKGAISKFGHTLTRGRDLFGIQEARLLGPDGLVISPDNRLFCEFTYDGAACRDNPVFRRLRIPKPTRLKGSYATLAYPLARNYYHWLVESLPNLRSLEPYLPLIDGFFIPRAKSYHFESLRAFGIGRDRIIELDQDSHYRCQRLYVPSFNSGWAPHRWIPRWIKDRILDGAGSGARKRIYVSRKDANWRRITNEAEVMELLAPLGFELVELSKLDFRQQARLFNSADTVISAHGAGLSNIVFCEPGTKILEIHPPRWTSFCYVKLSDIAGCSYYYMIAEPLGMEPKQVIANRQFYPPDHLGQAGDIEIPIDKLTTFIQHL